MKHRINGRGRIWLALGLLLFTLLMNTWGAPAQTSYAQGKRSLFSKAMTTTERNWDNFMSRTWKAERGERINVEPVMRKMGYELEERFWEHEVFQRGIDVIYRDLKHERFNVVEAKATTSTERLYLGLLRVNKGGERQMDDVWIRKKLDEAYRSARSIVEDRSATNVQKMSAYRTIGLVEDIKAIRQTELEKTLVITRLNGINPKVTSSVAPDLLAEFSHVIEVGRNGRTLFVHK